MTDKLKAVSLLDFLEANIDDADYKDATCELWGRCPNPEHLAIAKKNDKDHWSVNLNLNVHNCYACGYSGSLIPLLQDLGLTRFEALRLASGPRPKRAKRRKQKIILPETALQPFRFNHFYWEERGITAETRVKFKLGYKERLPDDTDDLRPFGGRIVIPVRDGRGALLGFCGRAIDDNRNPKYYYTPGLDTRRYLFMFNYVQRGPVFLVEGMIDALRLWQLGIQAVTCFGSELFDEQRKKLTLVDRLYMIPDSDAKGRKFTRDVVKKIPALREVIHLPIGFKDIGAMQDDDILAILAPFLE